MKLKALFFLIVTSLSLTVFSQQKKIAVYVTGDDPVNDIVASRLVDGLARNEKYTTVERTASFLNAISKEHSYERNGAVDDDEIAAIGRQFSVQYVCVASVYNVWTSDKYITARIIDVETSEVVATSSSAGSITSSSELITALNTLSENFLKALDYNKKTGLQKVAVYVTKTGNRDVDVILGDQLVSGFSKSGKYIAIERTNSFLSQISKEQGYQQSGAVDDEELTRLGKQFGVQYICVAKTTSWAGDYFISTRLIDVASAEVINSYNVEGKKISNTQNVLEIASEIAEKLSGRTIKEEFEWKSPHKGELQLNEGKYVGMMKEGIPIEKGILYYNEDNKENKLSYEGDWNNGKMTGTGKIVWRDGSSYIGSVVDGKRQGKGKYYYKSDIENNRLSYEGDWNNDQMNGEGEIVWKDGARYKGSIRNGSRNGRGQDYYPDGSLMVSGKYGYAYYENNVINGNAIVYYINGRIEYEGGFRWGSHFDEYGKFYNEKGEIIFEGKMERVDVGKIYYNDGSYYEGRQWGCIPSGEGAYYKNGKKYSCTWQKGECKKYGIILRKPRESSSLNFDQKYSIWRWRGIKLNK